MRHSARHRASRHGILRRRVQPSGAAPRGRRERGLLRRGPAVAALAAGIGVLALASSPSVAAEATRVAVITPFAAAQAAAVPAAAARAGVTRTAGPAARQPRRQLAVVVGCARRSVVMPRAMFITCADADDYLTGLRWVSWDSVAFGHGIEHINDCTPSCAAGRFRAYRVLVMLWRPAPQAGQPGMRFTRITELYTGWRPVEYTPAGRPYRPQTVTRRI